MQPKQVEALLHHLGTKPSGTRGEWVLASCPMAPWKHLTGKDAHPSFGIKSSKTKKSICKCFSCGYGGDLTDLVMDIGLELKKGKVEGYNLSAALQLVANEFVGLEFDSDIPDYGDSKKASQFLEYPDWWLASFQPVQWPSVASQYLLSRGITQSHAKALDLRYDPFQNRVCFPFRDFSGRLAGVQGRALDKTAALRYFFYDYSQHKNMHVWLGEHHLNFDKPVFLCEGPFDYARIYKHYPNVAASFSASFSKAKLERMADAVEIITFYDYGNGGEQARARVSKYMKGIPVQHIIPTEEEDDAGGMADEVLVEYLSNFVKVEQNAW